jgi:hypothetical protein
MKKEHIVGFLWQQADMEQGGMAYSRVYLNILLPRQLNLSYCDLQPSYYISDTPPPPPAESRQLFSISHPKREASPNPIHLPASGPWMGTSCLSFSWWSGPWTLPPSFSFQMSWVFFNHSYFVDKNTAIGGSSCLHIGGYSLKMSSLIKNKASKKYFQRFFHFLIH